MRAAAAERRLAGLTGGAGPSSGVKYEEGDLKPMKDDDDFDNEAFDVPDPHMNAEERKREMEVEMNQAERRDLRGGYEEFIKSEPDTPAPSGKGIKRELDVDQTEKGRPSSKKGTSDRQGFGADIVKQERLRSLGMSQTTLSTSGNVLGKRLSLGIEHPSTPDEKPAIAKEWACQVCTFLNESDRASCGESAHGRCLKQRLTPRIRDVPSST